MSERPKWNWQQPDWPRFTYNAKSLKGHEDQFLHETGLLFGAFRHLGDSDQEDLKIELISREALKTSEIEGEYLNRDSVQSSLRRQFGLAADSKKILPGEEGIAELMVDLYETYDHSLSHTQLHRWHQMLMAGRNDLKEVGRYRTGGDPMQVVSGPIHRPNIHFEAPPGKRIKKEMDQFVAWFNQGKVKGIERPSALTLAGVTHLYFESIHPFEDGNGRIGRALSEKALARSLGQPTLISLAATINRNKKSYYKALEIANKGNEITNWLLYFSNTILEALGDTRRWTEFLIEKTKLMDRMRGQLNPRQEKCLLRMFREGPEGFSGGLNAEKYIRITSATRPTATRDLADLVSIGALTRTGERKSTRYQLNI